MTEYHPTWPRAEARRAGIGPGHPNHPDYRIYYAPDGMLLDTQNITERVSALSDVAQSAVLGVVSKPDATVGSAA